MAEWPRDRAEDHAAVVLATVDRDRAGMFVPAEGDRLAHRLLVGSFDDAYIRHTIMPVYGFRYVRDTMQLCNADMAYTRHLCDIRRMKRIGKRIILVMPEAEIVAIDAACSARELITNEPLSRSAFIRRAVRAALERLPDARKTV